MSERAIEDAIAKLLREERARHRISLDSVAAHCCVSVPAAYHWEQGETKPSTLWHLRRWVEACDATLVFKIITKDGEEMKF